MRTDRELIKNRLAALGLPELIFEAQALFSIAPLPAGAFDSGAMRSRSLQFVGLDR
ncbi:MAG: hypothetical protein SXA11_00065 [Cyanobacteriota bacterium]|nr:hypothetical protein [Cyanobacteriota bacterium]